MKRIAFLMSICLLAVMPASPLAAQIPKTGNLNTDKKLAEMDARIKKVLAEAVAITNERERAAAAAGKPLPQRGSDPRVKKLLAEANTLEREWQRLAAAAGISLPQRGAANTVRAQPQITVSSPFWRNAEFAKTVGLTTDQQKKMEEVFQQNRLNLIDLNGSLAKEESVLSSLMADLQPEEESRVRSQIDRVAEVRAELEKTNARMLLGFRQVMTPEQWNKLSTSKPVPEVKR
jgi:Spy/CpxP family protein refolding chaperone